MSASNGSTLFTRLTAWSVAFCLSFASTASVHILSRVAATRIALLAAPVATPYLAFAQSTPEEAATAGNATAREERAKLLPPSSDAGANTLKLNSTNPTVNSTTFSISDLFNQSNTAGNGLLLTNSAGQYGNMNALQIESNTQTGNLMDAGNSTSWANAYRTLRNSVTTNPGIKDDLRADPALLNTQAIANSTDANNFLGGMSNSCTTTTTTSPSTTTIRNADIRTCDQYVAPSLCTVKRAAMSQTGGPRVIWSFTHASQVSQFTIQVVSATSGGTTVTAEAPWVGAGLDLAGLFHEGLDGIATPVVVSPHAPTQMPDWNRCTYSLDTSGYGYLVATPTEGNNYLLSVWAWANGTESDSGWFGWQTQVTVTETCGTTTQSAIEAFPQNCDQSTVCTAQPTTWTPGSSIEDQVSTAAWRCVSAANSGVVDGVAIGPNTGLSLPELFPGEPKGSGVPVCFKAEARNYVCDAPSDIPTDNCDHLTSNAQCIQIGAECLPENRDTETNQCIFETRTYDCGTDITFNDSQNITTTSCVGPIRCMGSTCVEKDPSESNPDFNEAVTQLSVAQWAQFDNDCATTTTGECELFTGEGHTCKVVFFGVQNCCDQPTGITMADYIRMVYFTYKNTNKEAVLNLTQSMGFDAAGAWTELSNWAGNTYAELSKPIVSAWDSLVSRGVDAALDTSTTISFEVVKQELLTGAKDATAAIFGPELADSLWGDAALSTFQESVVGQAAGFIMAAYFYYQMFVLAVQIIWECEEQEIELAFLKEAKSCTYLGRYCASKFLGVCYERKDSFCCFKSPLARIIQEQVKRTTVANWPPPSANPDCPGISISDFQNIDWSLIDLSEWIMILKSADLMPTGMATADELYSSDKITRFPTQTDYIGASTAENAADAMAGSSPADSNAYVRAQLWMGLP